MAGLMILQAIRYAHGTLTKTRHGTENANYTLILEYTISKFKKIFS